MFIFQDFQDSLNQALERRNYAIWLRDTSCGMSYGEINNYINSLSYLYNSLILVVNR